MPWLPYAGAVAGGIGVTPAGSGADSIVTYIIGYGPLGIVAIALAWVLYRGLFVLAKTADKDKAEAVALARADLLKDLDRQIARAEQAEKQRDDALRIAQVQLVPLLTSFVATSQSLIPLLQDLVRKGGG